MDMISLNKLMLKVFEFVSLSLTAFILSLFFSVLTILSCRGVSSIVLLCIILYIGLHIPTLFVGSDQFRNYPHLNAATVGLAAKTKLSSPVEPVCHVLPDSRHQNFTDVGFWLPVWLLRYVGAVGKCDYDNTYDEILKLTQSFLKTHTNKI